MTALESEDGNDNSLGTKDQSDDDDELAYRGGDDPYTDVSSMSEEGAGGCGQHQHDLEINTALQISTMLQRNAASSNAVSNEMDPDTAEIPEKNNGDSSYAVRGNTGGGTVLESICPQPSSPQGNGSIGVASAASGSPTGGRLRFYDDSEDEGAGSLVFVESAGSGPSPRTPPVHQRRQSRGEPASLFLRSSNSSEEGNGSVVRVDRSPSFPHHHAASDAVLLPYHHRKKLSAKELQQPSIAAGHAAEAVAGGVDGSRRPPLALPPAQRSPPQTAPPTPQTPPSAAKFKVASIPPFKKGRTTVGGGPAAVGGEGGQTFNLLEQRNQTPLFGPEESKDSNSSGKSNKLDEQTGSKLRKIKSVPGTHHSNHNQSKINKNNSSTSSPHNSPENAAAIDRNSDGQARPPLAPPNSSSNHDVIDPGYNSPAPGHSASHNNNGIDAPSSPKSGGYHIRINSMRSMSSLENDERAEGGSGGGGAYPYERYGAPPPVPPHQYGHAPLLRHPSSRGGSSPSAVAPAVDFDDVLGQEVAHFLQEERIAALPQHPPHLPQPDPHRQWQPPPRQRHEHARHGPAPLHPGGYHGKVTPESQGLALYHPHYPGALGGGGYPSSLPQSTGRIEPPPLTPYHPNMTWERTRERCPSISEDEWANLRYTGENQGERDGSERQFNHNSRIGLLQGMDSQHGQHQHQHQQQYMRQHPYENPRMQYPRGTGVEGNYDRYYQQQQQNLYPPRGRRQGDGNVCHPNETSALLSPPKLRHAEHASKDTTYNEMYQMGMECHFEARGSTGGRYHSDSKKKRSKRRRREKEKRRQQYASETSEDDDAVPNSHHSSHHNMGGSSKSKKSKSKSRSHRKRGPPKEIETLSVTYSDSRFSGGTGSLATSTAKREMRSSLNPLQQLILWLRLLVCNLPPSFAALPFSFVLLGIVWRQWAQETRASCREVAFHSSQCAFADFPGCYFCDSYDPWYVATNRLQLVCSYIAGFSVLLFFIKAAWCPRVFMDEMSSPTTASPNGLIFMTMALSFAGKGETWGGMVVAMASILHLVLLVWFIYMSMAYGTMADPSWFPNTVGIGLCAVKIWFYYPLLGHFLVAIALIMTFFLFPVCLIRVALNEKMSATICWMNMTGPAVTLYSLAIIMQPTFQQERPDITHLSEVQRSIYLPSMTCLFVLCLVGMVSSMQGLIMRRQQVAQEEFSPAHAAYSFPLLMHALAVQSYRSALDFFANADAVSPVLMRALHAYWVALVIAGTTVAIICGVTYLVILPSWVVIDTVDEVEPPSPQDTSISDLVTYGESLIQSYVSPTILQANETGTLIMAYDYQNGWCDLVRTRRIPAFGFEPMMGKQLFQEERNILKLFVGGQGIIQEGDEEADDLF